MDYATSTTFDVSEVERARKSLPEIPYKRAVEALLFPGPPEAPARQPVEACARYEGQLVAGVEFHPFVAAAHLAFRDHRPLRFSPDAIWLLICQAVAHHINARSDDLRSRLVRHEGRLRIEVRRDDFVKGSPENPWPEVFDEFSARVREHVGPSIDLFIPAFSTTGATERAAAEVVLLDAVRSYFEYRVRSLCGIPAITLEGTIPDWEALAGRAEAFAEYGLSRWVEILRPILGQFVRAARGDVDRAFWQSLYKLRSQSGGPVVTGWVLAFFPYLKDSRTGLASRPVNKLLDDGLEAPRQVPYVGEDSSHVECLGGPTLESIPGGLSSAPFQWENRGGSFDMEFLGGFVGVAQDPETLALRPEIGWAVSEARS